MRLLEGMTINKVVIAVICHQGIGSSFWLKLLVEKFVEQYQIPTTIIQSDLMSLAKEDIDIVIGMNYLSEELKNYGKTSIILNNILSEELNQKLLENEIIKRILRNRGDYY